MRNQPTMRALLQKEIAKQERYIKAKLTSLLIPFKKSLHFRVSKAYTTFLGGTQKATPHQRVMENTTSLS